MKPAVSPYACQVCGETGVTVYDHGLLRCFACIDAGKLPDGVQTGTRVRAVGWHEVLLGWVDVVRQFTPWRRP